MQEDDDHDDYWYTRFHAARQAGLTKLEAKRFADGPVTLKVLRECVKGGARPETIARITT